MNNSKTLSTILSAFALSLSSSLMAMDIRTQSNNLSPLSSVTPGSESIDEGAGAHRSLSRVTNYIKSARSGVRVNLTKFKKGYSMATPKKIEVSVNPVGKSFQSGQPISKIDSKVRFHGTESDFLYFTFRAGATHSLFRLMLMNSEADPSQLYLGYYEEDESHVIESGSPGLTAAPLFLEDVTVRLNGAEPGVNSTALPAYSAQPSDSLLAKTNGSLDLSSKRPELKLFRPVLTLAKDQEYSIEVAWKSMETLSSTSMPDPGSMTRTIATPSPIFPTLTTFSTPSAGMDGKVPDTPAAIPEDVPTQIIVRNKDGEILTALNLNLTLRHFSFSDAYGQLLEYGINGSRVDQLTKVNTQNHYVHNQADLKKSKNYKGALLFPIWAGSVWGTLGIFAIAIGVTAACRELAEKKRRSMPEAVSL